MNNAELKERIQELVADEDMANKILILEGDECANGAIGVTEDNHVVYSYEKLIKSMAEAWKDNYPTVEDARQAASEWIEYNTLRSLPYARSQGNVPIIMYEL